MFQALLEKHINFHCIYDFSVFLLGVTWQKQKLGLCIWLSECDCSRRFLKNKCYLKINFHCIYDFSVFNPGIMWQKQKLALCIWLVSVIVTGITWKTHQFSLYIYDFSVFVPRCIMTKTKITIMPMISECDSSRCYLKNSSIFIVYVILMCLFLV